MRLLFAIVALAVAAAFASVGAQILVTGELPRAESPAALDGPAGGGPSEPNPRAVGGTAVGMGLALGLIGLALLRARARARAELRRDLEAAARLGLDPRLLQRPRGSGAWGPVAAVGAGLALLAARFGDDLGSLRATRSLGERAAGVADEVLDARTVGVRATSEADFFEDPLEAVGLLLDANDVREAYELARAGGWTDLHVAARIALTETLEVYRRVSDDAYALVEQRHVRRTSIAIDGVLTASEVVEDTSPLDQGDSMMLRFHTRRVEADGRELAELSFERRESLGAKGHALSFTIPNEAEVASATWDAARGTAVVTLRTTAAGRARAAAALAAVTRDAVAPKLTAGGLVGRELTFDVRVPTVAEATLTLVGDTLELRAPGATVLDWVGSGQR